MSDLDQLLERAAEELDDITAGEGLVLYDSALEVLKRRLLPLLEAGQDLFDNTCCSCVHLPAMYPCPRCKLAIEEWPTAKQAALEGKS